jgi:hypothetical protein
MIRIDRDTYALTIDFSGVSETLLQIGAWEDGLNVRRLDGDTAEPFDDDLGIPLAILEQSGEEAATWVGRIPREIRAIVEPFSWRQWYALCLLRADPRLVELALDDEALQLLNRPRREVLRRLGLPHSAWVARFMRRLRFARYRPDTELHLRRFFAVPQQFEALRTTRGLLLGEALPYLSRNPLLLEMPWLQLPLDFLSRNPVHNEAACRAYLEEVADTHQILHDTIALTRPDRQGDTDRVPAAVRAVGTLRELQALHDARVGVLNARRALPYRPRYHHHGYTPCDDLPFPSPPVPSSDTIIALCSEEELYTEGFQMGHCVGVYGSRVRAGDNYIYKVLAPERATVEIGILAPGKFAILQLRGPHNRRCSDETMRAVMTWLDTEATEVHVLDIGGF